MLSELSYEDQGLVDPCSRSHPDLEQILNEIAQQEANQSRGVKRKRTSAKNNKYTPEQRAEGAKLCKEVGPKKAAQHMTIKLGFDVNESTIRGWKKIYLGMLNEDETINAIHEKKRGCPTKLPADCEEKLLQRVELYSRTGRHLTAKHLIRMAYSICKRMHPIYASRMKLGKAWTQSFFRRIKYCRRKVTRAARRFPSFPEIEKIGFLKKVVKAEEDYSIPPQLIMNFDQTGIQLVPTKNHTMARRGSKQVTLIGKGDKRGITAVLCSTLTGRLLAPQLIYKGTTTRCHPNYTFPDKWHITHNLTHWSDTETMHEFLNEIIIPYCVATRNKLGLPEDQKCLLILDVYKPHVEASFVQACKDAHLCLVYVPAGCTGSLQPLDAEGGVNQAIKNRLVEQFDKYQDELYEEVMGPDLQVDDNYETDLKLSTIKPHHADWFHTSFNEVRKKRDLIKKGWQKTGIMAALEYE